MRARGPIATGPRMRLSWTSADGWSDDRPLDLGVEDALAPLIGRSASSIRRFVASSASVPPRQGMHASTSRTPIRAPPARRRCSTSSSAAASRRS